MLQIKNISKTYKTGDLVQKALDNVSLNLRDNEFVSILGPSGSGKTTLLNIIGGLDKYDSGDLIINNVSTSKYKDRDWDSYRNHTIGFVFQSYNLIPHQTVLSNVELALTISGVSKAKRRQMALDALDKVGLKEQAHKKPNQMSGGQMQRVAIARALVNNPDILLADEPTGALDSKTSVTIMELLKEVAKDRLVVMVTHNPELAQLYSTRIVKLQDGHIIDDSNPLTIEENEVEHKNLGKSSMSLLTAFSLSFNNLLTKKARTILTAFAGSIGIIGIALILSVSQGFQNYIDNIQEETLGSYPLTITKESSDFTSLILSLHEDDDVETKEGELVEKQFLTKMFSSVGTNDLKSFKTYLENNKDKYSDDVKLVQYKYDVTPYIYTIDAANNLTQLNPNTLMSSMYSSSITSSSMSSFSSVFNELVDDQSILDDSYDLKVGKWPENYDEVIITLSSENQISDLLLYELGFKDTNELKNNISKILAGKEVDINDESITITFDDLMNLDLRVINSYDMYKYNSEYSIYEDMSSDKDYMQNLYDNNSIKLKVVGIAILKDGSTSTSSSGVGYKSSLIEKLVENAANSEIVKKQLENEEVDVISNKKFDEENSENSSSADIDFSSMISVDQSAIASAFGNGVDQELIQQETTTAVTNLAQHIIDSTDKDKTKTALEDGFTSLTNGLFNHISITKGISFEVSDIETIVSEYITTNDALTIINNLNSNYTIEQVDYKDIYNAHLIGLLSAYSKMQPQATTLYVPTDEIISTLVTTYLSYATVDMTFESLADTYANIQKAKYASSTTASLVSELVNEVASSLNVDTSKIASAFTFDMSSDELSRIMESMTSSSESSSYENNLAKLGYADLDDPKSISFYFESFDAKENFLDVLDAYNDSASEKQVINYTDTSGLLMSSVKVIVDAVSYVLIAFVSISLIVSSIMIGIITYISVLERTKEIGILRAIGASKHNISSIFNAETFIIGLISGLMGIGISQLLIIVINKILHNLMGNTLVNAVLEFTPAVILICLSVILTLIGGLIPSKKAARQDPVKALRSE